MIHHLSNTIAHLLTYFLTCVKLLTMMRQSEGCPGSSNDNANGDINVILLLLPLLSLLKVMQDFSSTHPSDTNDNNE